MNNVFPGEKIFLWHDENIRTASGRPSIAPMLVPGTATRPAVLVIPGGGYGCVCNDTEGYPIGKKFNELGYHAFVLDYRTAPDRWPCPQLDAMRAMKMIRANAEKWHVEPTRVYVCGFSAGAHLAGSLGTICGSLDAGAGDESDTFPYMPDGMILCYGVLSLAAYSNQGTRVNLLGEVSEEVALEFSLPEHVSGATPPTFLMHTIRDQVVPYRNSMEFADAMAKNDRPCQLALYNWGDHGMLLGINTLDVVRWPEEAVAFMESVEAFAKDTSYIARYTNSYQAQMEKNCF